MTLEFENPPFLSNIGLNSSYNNETDFTALDRVTKAKKTSIISGAVRMTAGGPSRGRNSMHNLTKASRSVS